MTLLRGDLVAWSEEITRQLGQQIPEAALGLSALRRALAEKRLTSGHEVDFSAADQLIRDASAILEDFAPRPIVILIDTIEEIIAQDMRDTFADSLTDMKFYALFGWIMRMAAQFAMGEVRVIYSGRIAPQVPEDQLQLWFDGALELEPSTIQRAKSSCRTLRPTTAPPPARPWFGR